MKGDFVEQITSSEFLKIKLGSLNVFPPPHKALFHDDFDANAAELVSMIKDKVPGIELVEAPAPAPAPAAAIVEVGQTIADICQLAVNLSPSAQFETPKLKEVRLGEMGLQVGHGLAMGRAKLGELRVKELRVLAKAAGATVMQFEDTANEDDPKREGSHCRNLNLLHPPARPPGFFHRKAESGGSSGVYSTCTGRRR